MMMRPVRRGPEVRKLAAVLAVLLAVAACSSRTSRADKTRSPATPTVSGQIVGGGGADATRDTQLLGKLAEQAKAGPHLPINRKSAAGVLQEVLPKAAGNQDAKFVRPDGGAAFTWEVNDRYANWYLRWIVRRSVKVERPVPHTDNIYGYSPDYVHPKNYVLSLYGCGSKSTDGTKLKSFSWRLEHNGALVGQQTGTCEPRFLIPAEGRYDVTLRTVSEGGRAYSLSASVNVQDIVIVSFGDSSASGEGNPTGTVSGGRWIDNRRHRSTTSGHALTAEALESVSRQSTVTFLSFACSGADIKNGVLGPYEGQDPKKATYPGHPELNWQEQDLVPQVQAAKEALCSVPVRECTPEDMRKPDLILIATGVNDLGFADVMTVCGDLDLGISDLLFLPITVLRHIARGSCDESEELNGALENAIISIDTRYEEVLSDIIPCDLSDAEWRRRLGSVPTDPPPFCFEGNNTYGEIRRQLIQAGLFPTDGVYLTTYPGDVFSKAGSTQRGCGIFKAINADEAKWIRGWA
jgi:hypothetical protein